jgi:hypothetical protein
VKKKRNPVIILDCNIFINDFVIAGVPVRCYIAVDTNGVVAELWTITVTYINTEWRASHSSGAFVWLCHQVI